VKAGDEDPDAPPTFQEKIVIRFLFSFCKFFIIKTYKHIVWNHHPHFSIVFMETSVSANIAHLRSIYDVTFEDDYVGTENDLQTASHSNTVTANTGIRTDTRATYRGQNTRAVPKLMPPIYFHGNYNRYQEHNNAV